MAQVLASVLHKGCMVASDESLTFNFAFIHLKCFNIAKSLLAEFKIVIY